MTMKICISKHQNTLGTSSPKNTRSVRDNRGFESRQRGFAEKSIYYIIQPSRKLYHLQNIYQCCDTCRLRARIKAFKSYDAQGSVVKAPKSRLFVLKFKIERLRVELNRLQISRLRIPIIYGSRRKRASRSVWLVTQHKEPEETPPRVLGYQRTSRIYCGQCSTNAVAHQNTYVRSVGTNRTSAGKYDALFVTNICAFMIPAWEQIVVTTCLSGRKGRRWNILDTRHDTLESSLSRSFYSRWEKLRGLIAETRSNFDNARRERCKTEQREDSLKSSDRQVTRLSFFLLDAAHSFNNYQTLLMVICLEQKNKKVEEVW